MEIEMQRHNNFDREGQDYNKEQNKVQKEIQQNSNKHLKTSQPWQQKQQLDL